MEKNDDSCKKYPEDIVAAKYPAERQRERTTATQATTRVPMGGVWGGEVAMK